MDLQLETADNNPLQQNLILNLVLENVGETDLKNCRLVNHSWNRIAVQVLEQRGFAAQLNIDKVAEFKSLLWNTQLSRMNCEQLELASLRLSVNLFPNNYSEHSTEVAKVIQFLLLHPQLRLAFIKCKYDGGNRNSGQGPGAAGTSINTILPNHELFNLLKLASPDLISLKLLDAYNLIPLRFEDFDFDSYLELEFPRLTSLHYRIHTEEAEDSEMMDLTRHVVSLIRGAPKLTKLKLYLSEGSFKTSTNIFRTIMRDCSTQLVDLSIEDGINRGLTEVLAQMRFPSLTTFKIKNGLYNFSKEFNQFLEFNCPSLRSITMEWSTAVIDHELDDEDFVIEFPYLPQVLHFGFFPSHSTSSSREPGNMEKVHLAYVAILTNLPSLRSMSLDLGVLFLLGAEFQASSQLVPPPDEYPTFPSLSTLEVLIDCPQEEMPDQEELDSATQVYHHTFPNLSTLKIKVSSSSVSDELMVVVRSIDFLCFHVIRPGFQHLEIQNYAPVAHSWMNQMSKINQEQLKSLKLVPPPRLLLVGGRQGQGGSSEGGGGLGIKLMKLLAKFPSLEFFQFGKEQVASREIETVRHVSKIVGRFARPVSSSSSRRVERSAAASAAPAASASLNFVD